jgi:hypothetical protein
VKISRIRHEFVDYIPIELESDVLYISIKYRTSSHLCACGCGFRVVTPIRPAQWRLLFDGETVSLSPSIGNHQFPCRSHYFVRNSQIHWMEQWTEDRAHRGWHQDDEDLEEHYSGDRGRTRGVEAQKTIWGGLREKLRRALRR